MDLRDVDFEDTHAPEQAAPPLRDLFAGAEMRAGWIRYHVAERLLGWLQVTLVVIFRNLPLSWVERVGRALGPVVGYLDRNRPYIGHMRRAVALIRGSDNASNDCGDGLHDANAVLRAWWPNTGAVYAQFAANEALGRRLELRGREPIDAALAQGRQVIILSMHIANWELIGALASHLFPPLSFVGSYEPQPNRYQNRLVSAARRREGLYAFPSSPGLARQLHGFVVKRGLHMVIMGDEVTDGKNQFPLFGRPPPPRGNLCFALRLAHRTQALLVPAYFEREAPDRPVAHLLPPLDLDTDLSSEAYVAAGIDAANAVFEPLVRDRLEEWYMLQAVRVY